MGALWEGSETPENQRNRFRNRFATVCFTAP